MKNIIFKRGYIALTTVLIFGSIAVTIATALILLGLGHGRSAFSTNQATQARKYADACVESSLREIKKSTPYTGTINLNFSNGTCESVVTSSGGQNRSITATGSVGNITKKIQINITNITPKIIIESWQEIL